MKIIGALLIALIAVMGIAAAAATINQVTITSPQDNDQFTIGDLIKIRSHVEATNDGQMFVRMLIDGVRSYASNWKPTDADVGAHIITVEAANNREFTNPTTATVKITVNPSPNST